MTAKFKEQSPERRGFVAALAAFFVWGSLPLYWKMLDAVPAFEILCHRMVWSFLFLLIILIFTGRLGVTFQIYKNKKALPPLILTGLIIACNWLTCIYAIHAGKVVEASLGYFINPLLTILIGIIVFKEKGSASAYVAIAIAMLGVIFQIIVLGHIPLIALILGTSFAIYGALKKIILVESLPSLFVETSIGFLPCLGYLFWLNHTGNASFDLSNSLNLSVLLTSTGAVTTLPLLAFSHGARNLRLTTLGLMQYVAPFITFALGVFVFKEDFSFVNLVTFGCIWVALIIYTVDSQRQRKRQRKKEAIQNS